MPVNKTALIRYKTINKCLRNTNRNWTLEDLIEACSKAILQIEGNNKGASKRTVQADLQLMRDPAMGYGAPIIVRQKKYYGYAKTDFSILTEQISQQDLDMLQEANDFLDQLQQFKHFDQLKNTHQEIQYFIAQKKAALNQTDNPLYKTDQKNEVLPQTLQPNKSLNEDLEQKGFTVANAIYSSNEIQQILQVLKQNLRLESTKETGLPLLFKHVPLLKSVMFNEKLDSLLNTVGFNNTQLINAIFYLKSPQTNFYTNPHQTITITVKERHQVDGFSGWSAREGVTSVMSPLHILKNMLSIKICLGDSNQQNGGIRVIPGSHKKILTIQERNFLIDNTLPVNVNAKQGDCQILKPLILKAFQNNKSYQNAPVIQLDFCNINLPNPLSWHAM